MTQALLPRPAEARGRRTDRQILHDQEATKQQRAVSFKSDSRVSFGEDHSADHPVWPRGAVEKGSGLIEGREREREYTDRATSDRIQCNYQRMSEGPAVAHSDELAAGDATMACEAQCDHIQLHHQLM